MMTNNE
jgi:hypothetical protein